jgi:tripeptide aminopeptidase
MKGSNKVEKVVERFLKYIKYDTSSKDDQETYPSTPGQLLLLKDIEKELISMGMQNVTTDKYGYVFAMLAPNIDKNIPTIGFIAHVDTSPEISGKDIKPQIIENYDGNDILLNKLQNIVLSPKDFPELKSYIGQTIITTDGTTLLGADDKAGVAEIITAMEYMIEHPEIKHGKIMIGLTLDEEVGRGVDFFDVKKFNSKFAYTVDGGAIGELECENFNAARADVIITGKNTHPGSAKGVMVNSILIGAEFINSFPDDETPENTEGYQGFYHIYETSGSVESLSMKYILRDFTMDGLNSKKEYMKSVADKLNKKYGKDTVKVKIKDQYYNMAEKIKENKDVVDIAYKAIQECGIKPKVAPIRGGTDGARLSYMGLPTPNLFTGGHNFHGRYEYIPVPSMIKAVEVIIKISELYAAK